MRTIQAAPWHGQGVHARLAPILAAAEYASPLTFLPVQPTTGAMVTVLFTLNALICGALIILILLQRSDPASGGMFGGAGGGGQPVIRNPLAKPTALLAAAFLIFSLVLALLNKGASHHGSVMTEAAAIAEVSSTMPMAVSPTAPALPLPGGMEAPAPQPAPQTASATVK